MIVFLSGMLILFNNPFYAITVLIKSEMSAVVEVIFILNFFVLLLFFFLAILDRIAYENGTKVSKVISKKKIGFSLIIYFFLFFTYLGFSLSHLKDPFIRFQNSFGGFYQASKIIGVILLSVYFLVIITYYIKIFSVFNSRIWRNRLLSLFSMYFIIICAIVVFTGSLDIYGSVGGRAFLVITILNLYVYYLQYMYSFSPEGFQEAAQLITLENGNDPQIYEIFDDNVDGSEIDVGQGSADEGMNKGLFVDKEQRIEKGLEDDIFNESKSQEENNYNNISDQKQGNQKRLGKGDSSRNTRRKLKKETIGTQLLNSEKNNNNNIINLENNNSKDCENNIDLDINLDDDGDDNYLGKQNQDYQQQKNNNNHNEDVFVLKLDDEYN